MADYDHAYLLFYNMQRLILIFNYHKILFAKTDEIEDDDFFVCADLIDYENLRNAKSGAASEISTHASAHGHISNSSNSRLRPLPLHIQLQKYLHRLMRASVIAKRRIHEIFAEFVELVLFLTLDENRENFKNLYRVFCAIPPG